MTPNDFRAAIGDMDDWQIGQVMEAIDDGNLHIAGEMVKRALKEYRRSPSTEGREDAVEMARRKA